MEETEVIEMIRQGNVNAFSFLVNKYQDVVFSLALKILKNREDAEEMAQEAFVKAFRSIHSFQGKSRFSTWLYSIAYNTCISHARRNKTSVLTMDQLPSDYDEYDEDTDDLPRGTRSGHLEVALRQLPPDDYSLIVLYYYEDQSVEEICQVTGLSESNIKVKLFRARNKLRNLMGDLAKKEIYSQL